MIGFDEAVRIVRLRERVIWATREALKRDGCHKSSEAHTSVSFCLPSMFDDDQSPYWSVEVYSYVLGPSRNHSWFSKTLPEALAKAESAIDKWCFMFEQMAFERAIEHGKDCAIHQQKCTCGHEEERRREYEEAQGRDIEGEGEENPRLKTKDDEMPF